MVLMMRTAPNACRGGLTSALLALACVGGCQKLNPDFIEPTETGTTGTSGPSTSTGLVPTADTTASSTTDPSTTDPTTGSTGTSGSTGGLACAPQFDSIRLSIFEPKCTNESCHVGADPAGSLDLTTADVFADLLDVPSATCAGWSRVVAQTPELSILYARVAGIATCEPENPVDHEVLPPEELECIAGWIETIEDCERCGGSECIDLTADDQNCGECGLVCPMGAPCVGGTCDCGTELACGTECIDPLTDPLNCGECGGDCSGAACLGGTCDCMPPLLNCGACVDTMTDDLHCGGCNQPCGLGESCQGGMCLCSDIAVSFAGQVQPIFTANCAANNCHGGNNPKQGMSLEAGMAFGDLVGVPAAQCNDGRLRVAPGDPLGSYLINKVQGVNLCGGVQMPQSGGPGAALSDADLDPMFAWICQGATDN